MPQTKKGSRHPLKWKTIKLVNDPAMRKSQVQNRLKRKLEEREDNSDEEPTLDRVYKKKTIYFPDGRVDEIDLQVEQELQKYYDSYCEKT